MSVTTPPVYHVRAGFNRGDWVEIACKWPTWDLIVASGFRWEELSAGPVVDADVEEISINREIGTIFDRLAVGQCRLQLDNSRAQYTATKSLMNVVPYSDNLTPGVFWVTSGANVSLAVLVGKSGAIDTAALSENNGNTPHTLASPQSLAVASGQAYTAFAEFYPGTRDRFVFGLRNTGATHAFDGEFSIRSLTAITSAAVGSASVIGASLQLLSDGWVRAWVSGRHPGDAATMRVALVNSAGAASYTGTGSAWLGVRAFQVMVGTLPGIPVATANSLAVFPRDTAVTINDVLAVKAQHVTWVGDTYTVNSVYSLFSGYCGRFDANPALIDLRKIQIMASDVADRLRPIITTSLFENVTHKTLLTAVMSEAAIDPTQYFIDNMNDIAAFAFLDQISAGEGLAQVQQSGAQVYFVDGRGRLVMRSRHWDVTSVTAVGSYSEMFGLTLTESADEVVNRVEVRTRPRVIFPDVATIAWLTDAVFIPGMGSKQFLLDFIDPITNDAGGPARDIQAQVRGVDYIFNEAPDGEGGDISSQVVVTVSLNATSAAFSVANNGGGNGYLTTCQLKGFSVTRNPDLSATIQDDPSVAKYQERFAQLQSDLLQNYNRVQNFAEFMIVQYAEPSPVLNLQLLNRFPDVYQRELLDHVWIANSHLLVASSHYVKALEHTITFDAGVNHQISLTFEKLKIKNWFTLDSATLGRLDYNRLGF